MKSGGRVAFATLVTAMGRAMMDFVSVIQIGIR
jgi:hypothetical protein